MTEFTQQRRFWSELVQLKAQACYLNLYHLQCVRDDTRLKVYLAIASSSSIGGWVIWRDLSFLWAAIVAIAQVLNAVRQYLPWEKRAAAVSELGRELADIVLTAEQRWYPIANGDVTEAEIHDSIMDLKRRLNEAEYRHLAGRPLPINEGHRSVAAERVREYFRTHYGLGG